MKLRFLTAGESHGPALTVILEGMPAGLAVDVALITRDLDRRRAGSGAGPRMQMESDTPQILCGIMDGKTTGAPVAICIPNADHVNWQGKAVPPFTVPRPGHADLAGAIKYGYGDLRLALERSSARETAARVAAGALCRQLLAQFDIQVGGYVAAIGSVVADVGPLAFEDRLRRARQSGENCPDAAASAAMRTAIDQARQARETLGGIIEVVALNVPPGLGSHVQWDRRLDAQLAAAVISIPAIKGIEFGEAFENTRLQGTMAHDAIVSDGRDINRPTQRSGGVEGGITTGQPLVIRVAMKPIPTTLAPQASVDLASGETHQTRYERSDICPLPRAVVVVEAMVAYALAAALLEKLGGDSMGELHERFSRLRRASLDDLPMDGHSHVFWPKQEEQG